MAAISLFLVGDVLSCIVMADWGIDLFAIGLSVPALLAAILVTAARRT